MKNDIPEYFVGLVKQSANLSNNEQTIRAIINVSDALRSCLDEKSKKLFFYLAPNYLYYQKNIFLANLIPNNNPYDHQLLIKRIMLKQNMTDNNEVNYLLTAFLKSIYIVSGSKKATRIKLILPKELNILT